MMALSKVLRFVMPIRTMASKSSPPSKITTTTTTPSKQDGKSEVKKAENPAEQDEHITRYSGQTSVNMNHDGVGFKSEKYTNEIYLNPLLTPPPRSPRTPEDFMEPGKLGHWRPIGFDYTNTVRDKYLFHEFHFYFLTLSIFAWWLWAYSPDFKNREWARREAFLRTAKREALGLPLIDRNIVDPERMVLPTEEELGDFDVTM